ncbi:MAG: hypothetical protein LH645_13685 [Actinomycetia bacterium]|nr:hypothetical protein [Actinomycetes bacterium]
MSGSGSDPDGSPAPAGHLRRLSVYLLVGGSIALGISVAYQWAHFVGRFSTGGDLGGGLATALFVQLLSVLGTVSLTGAVFGFLLLAMRADREARAPGRGVEDLD